MREISLKTLDIWANSNIYYFRQEAVENPNTPPEVLDRLANDEYISVRYRVAQNPNTSPETLARMVNDGEYWIRCAVAQNPKTPQYIKEYLNAVEFMVECYES